VVLLSNVVTFWQADDVGTPLWHEIYYEVGQRCYRQDIVDLAAAGLADSGWGIYFYEKGQQKGWERTGESLWPYSLGPIVTWQHWPRAGRFYGAGEFGDIQLNTAINRILSLGNKVINNHAFPRTMTDADPGQMQANNDVDTLWHVPKGAQVWNLEMQTDLSAILNYVERLSADYNTQGRTVDVAGGPADFSSVTNLAIQVSFMPQVDANEILRRQYGWAIVETSKRLQMLAGQDYSVDPRIVWSAALPEDRAAIAQVVLTEDQLGIASKETQATQFGLDWSQEQERMRQESALSQTNQ
jgi:hypothetical protein